MKSGDRGQSYLVTPAYTLRGIAFFLEYNVCSESGRKFKKLKGLIV
jgi:hypothetical protein